VVNLRSANAKADLLNAKVALLLAAQKAIVRIRNRQGLLQKEVTILPALRSVGNAEAHLLTVQKAIALIKNHQDLLQKEVMIHQALRSAGNAEVHRLMAQKAIVPIKNHQSLSPEEVMIRLAPPSAEAHPLSEVRKLIVRIKNRPGLLPNVVTTRPTHRNAEVLMGARKAIVRTKNPRALIQKGVMIHPDHLQKNADLQEEARLILNRLTAKEVTQSVHQKDVTRRKPGRLMKEGQPVKQVLHLINDLENLTIQVTLLAGIRLNQVHLRKGRARPAKEEQTARKNPEMKITAFLKKTAAPDQIMIIQRKPVLKLMLPYSLKKSG
jgi:hypothetical protein